MALGDVVDHGKQPVVAFGAETSHSRFDLDAAPILPDQRGLVTEGPLAARQPLCQLVRQLLSLIRRRELDQRPEGGKLHRGIARQVPIGCVARDEPAALGDDQTLADVADRVKER